MGQQNGDRSVYGDLLRQIHRDFNGKPKTTAVITKWEDDESKGKECTQESRSTNKRLEQWLQHNNSSKWQTSKTLAQGKRTLTGTRSLINNDTLYSFSHEFS